MGRKKTFEVWRAGERVAAFTDAEEKARAAAYRLAATMRDPPVAFVRAVGLRQRLARHLLLIEIAGFLFIALLFFWAT